MERGIWVTIGRDKGDVVKGWLLGEIPQGLLVALDENLADVRLVTEYYSISYNHEKKLSKLHIDEAEQVQEELQSLSNEISEPMRNAVSKIKFDRLHQFGHRSAELRNQIYRVENQRERWNIGITPRDELIGFLLAQADQSTALHKDVYETFEDSGITSILDEFGPKLTHLPAELTLPAYDLEFSSREDLESTLKSAQEHHWTVKKHRDSINTAEEIRMRLIVEGTKESKGRSKSKLEKPDDSTLFSRWFGPSLRIIAGTGLATANAAVGITAGLTITIATIGATAVPAYVGIATSIYTGLTQVADGLEKINRCK